MTDLFFDLTQSNLFSIENVGDYDCGFLNKEVKSNRKLYILLFVVVVIAVALMGSLYYPQLISKTSRGIGLFCDPGPVVTIDCTPASPCVWWGNNQNYVKGDMCHAQLENELCSPELCGTAGGEPRLHWKIIPR